MRIKRNFLLVAIATVMQILACSSIFANQEQEKNLSQPGVNGRTETPVYQTQQSTQHSGRFGQEGGELERGRMSLPEVNRMSEIIDKSVKNPTGQKLGRVSDLVISQNQVNYLVLSLSGFMGVGEKLIPIPFNMVRLVPEKEHIFITVNVDIKQLEKAPYFAQSTWHLMDNPNFEQAVNSYYAGR